MLLCYLLRQQGPGSSAGPEVTEEARWTLLIAIKIGTLPLLIYLMTILTGESGRGVGGKWSGVDWVHRDRFNNWSDWSTRSVLI